MNNFFVKLGMLGKYLSYSRSVFEGLNRVVHHRKLKLHNTCVRVMSSANNYNSTHLERTENSTRQKETTSATVIACSNASPTVKTITLKVTNPNFNFKAGQWVDFFIPGVSTVGGFSMSSSPMQLQRSRTLDLAIKYSKYPPAHWVHNKCKIGDSVEMKVGGDFFYDPTPEQSQADLLLIAGGVGINPLYSIISQVAHLKQDGNHTRTGKVVLLYSSKTENELLFKERLEKLAAEMEELSCYFHVTAADSNPLIKNEITVQGERITNQHLESAINELDQSSLQTYICGPPPMIQSIVSTLTGLGQPSLRIHYEQWW